MKLIITGDKLSINTKIKELADKHLGQKIDKYLEKFNRGIRIARLTLKKGARWGFGASLKLNLPEKGQIFAKAQGKDLLSVLTTIRKQTIIQIKEYKEKLINR